MTRRRAEWCGLGAANGVSVLPLQLLPWNSLEALLPAVIRAWMSASACLHIIRVSVMRDVVLVESYATARTGNTKLCFDSRKLVDLHVKGTFRHLQLFYSVSGIFLISIGKRIEPPSCICATIYSLQIYELLWNLSFHMRSGCLMMFLYIKNSLSGLSSGEGRGIISPCVRTLSEARMILLEMRR